MLSSAEVPEIRRWPTPRSREWTLQLLKKAANDENIAAVVAIGSAVRPAVPSADLDLVVICKEPSEMRARPPLEIDLRKYRVDHVQEKLAAGDDILGWAIKFGRVLFQRNRYWNDLEESWRDRVPLPSPHVATKRANEAHCRLKKVLDLQDIDAAEELALSYATHLARAELLKRGVYPASRPELPSQLRKVGAEEAADCFAQLIDRTADHSKQISGLVEKRRLAGSCT